MNCVVLDSSQYLDASLLEATAEPTRPSKQINGDNRNCPTLDTADGLLKGSKMSRTRQIAQKILRDCRTCKDLTTY